LNFKLAGPRLGADAPEVAAHIGSLDSDTIKQFAQTKKISFTLNGQQVNLTDEEVEIVKSEKEGFAIESNGTITVAVATELTDDLIDEGFAREIVNKIQNMRKSSGFEVTDYITVSVSSSERLKSAAVKYDAFIRRETLAKRIEFTDRVPIDGGREWNINGEKAAITVAKA
jgi:isoleucyl-tRNA synthetase